MNQIIKDKILQLWNEFDKKDNKDAYQYFNENYSLRVLNSLSVEEQAKRLFATVDYADKNKICRGYFCWAENGRKINGKQVIDFGKAKSGTGSQPGVVIEVGDKAYYYEGEKRDKTLISDKLQLNKFTTTTVKAINKICELTKQATLKTTDDYKSLYSQIAAYLVGLKEDHLYWEPDGRVCGQLIKYLHCSFPDKFSTWYSKGPLQNILEEIDPKINRDEEAFVLNWELTNVANSLGIDDLANFGVMIKKIVKTDHRNKFKKWLTKQNKENGESYSKDTINTYTSSMQRGFKKFSSLINEYKTIFHISDIATFDKACEDIVNNPKFNEFTARSGNGSCQAGLKKYKEYLSGIDEELEEVEELENNGIEMVDDMFDVQKNTILYGPPGTGKTYSTMQYAVAIIESRSINDVQSDDIDDVKESYKTYVENGLIEFTTFHQSYGYEDFIEGIKPIIDSEDGTDTSDVQYKVEPGVFKAFCEKNRHSNKVTLSALGINDTPTIWKVSLKGTGDNPVRKDCLDNGRIRIGYESYGKDLPEELGEGKNVLNAFYYGMKIGDIVLSCYSASTIDAIGVITGDPEWIDDYADEYNRTRTVKWLVKGIREDIIGINNNKTLSMPTIYRLNNISFDDVMSIVLKNNTSIKDEKTDEKNCVFIIDEINRGNISKIFGELITLIEDNKRIGASEEKYVRLPYSKKLFGVPSNVFILGTMNTADRSIATIDTALRRRFDFVEMMPDAEYLDNIMVDGEISLKELFVRMNRKISLLYDREHTVGHAYFKPLLEEYSNSGAVSIKTLGQIFKKKIMPLLQEYFYDDYEKIRLVLGDNKATSENDQFIKISKVDYSTLFGTSDLGSDDAVSYEINEDAFFNIEAYRHI